MFMAHNPWRDFDLIVVDFTLDNHAGNGAGFITTVRNSQVFTEIIFYSSKNSSDLWSEIHEKKLEGVFVANRKLIDSKIIRVAEQSVRKVLDLENMRGIVMAQVGEFDSLLDEIFVAAMEKLPQQTRHEILMSGHKNIKEQADDRHAALEAFIQQPSVEDLLKMCDSNKRWQNFCRVRKHHPKLKEVVKSDYVADILNKRNFLAHGISAPHEQGGHIFTYNDKQYHFNDEESLSLRQLMSDYKKLFLQAIEVARQ